MATKEQIKDIMDNIDWVKIHNVMKFLDWKYFDSDDTPTVHRLMETVKDLIINLDKTPDSKYLASGGFFVYKTKKGYDVHFSLENWDTEIVDIEHSAVT